MVFNDAAGAELGVVLLYLDAPRVAFLSLLIF